MLITFDHILQTYAYQPCLTTGMRNSLFDGQGVADNQSGRSWSVGKIAHMECLDQILHTYLYEHRPATGMQSGNETSWGVISAG